MLLHCLNVLMEAFAKLAEFALLHIKLTVIVCGTIFITILIIIIVGENRPTYSRWYRMARSLNTLANTMYLILILIAILEIVVITLKIKHFF